MTITNELLVLRGVDTKSMLFPFMKSLSKWELLLTIAELDGNPDFGIWNYIDMLHTRTENPMTMYAFVKLKIEEGCLEITRSEKKSRKSLKLSPQLAAELAQFIESRRHTSLPEVTNIAI
ncbi:hypothetical protein [uncultured Lentibacter sp.]|jgi:hypothetical protein|uniref:hypothetical protein n=1 Tax=uncultured Lentibacter sp. TaxID=1659309 RepID=UPI00260B2789|nr:hypothetical protein [uncultured Lentibacter sp.]